MIERLFVVLREIPDAERRLGRIPRDDFANGLSDFSPLAGEVSANNFGCGAGEIVAGNGEMKMKPCQRTVKTSQGGSNENRPL